MKLKELKDSLEEANIHMDEFDKSYEDSNGKYFTTTPMKTLLEMNVKSVDINFYIHTIGFTLY